MNQSQFVLKGSPYISEIARSEFIMQLETEKPTLKRTTGMADMHMASMSCRASSEDSVIAIQDITNDLFELRRPASTHPQLPKLVVTTLRGCVSETDAPQDNGVYFGRRNEEWKTLTALDSVNERQQLFQVYLHV